MSVADPVVRAVKDKAAESEREALRQEIRIRLVQLKKLTELGITGGLGDSLEHVNRKIRRFNELAPDEPQALPVTEENFVSQIRRWE